MVLNQPPFLFEINIVMENHPSVARAAALISQEKIIFSIWCFTMLHRDFNYDQSG